jgi:maltose alpha-D-glucosyltransferase/alpha-amylase
MDPTYGYQAVNVEAQLNNTNTLMHWTRRMIQVRKQHPAFGLGGYTELGNSNPSVLTFLRELAPADGEGYSDVILCVNNLSRFPQAVMIDLSTFAGQIPVELTGTVPFPKIGENEYMITLPGHGFYWFAMQPDPATSGEQAGSTLPSEAQAAVQP